MQQPSAGAPEPPRGPAPWDAPRRRRRPGEQVREFFAGVGVFFRGVRMWASRPGLMALGAVPALIVSVAYVLAIVALGANAGAIAEWATPFADGWPEAGQQLLRLLVAVAVVAAAVAAGVLTFAAVTLAVAAPFMERISRAVDVELGGAPAPIDEPVLRAVGRGIGDALKLIGIALLTAILVFVVGLVPVLGSVLGWTTGAVLGGRALSIDLTGAPAEARGIRLAQRERLLARNRARALGFGMMTYLAFLVPGGAVVGTPAAAVGGTLLLRELIGQPARLDRSAGGAAPTAPPGPVPPSDPSLGSRHD
ncbi:MAG: EI24 domain-containing protein [Microbacteriaceae bacterium]|nr:EI24 domain-containing protein [Microbacteriaceae bacterium]